MMLAMRSSRSISAILLVLAAVVLALASGGCQSSASVTLSVGDCFDNAPAVDANGDNVVAKTLVDCPQPHDGEVFLVFLVPAAPSGYPGDEAIGSLQQTRCDAAFAGYVGKDPGLSSYTIDYVRPTIDTWSRGDRTIDCLLEDAIGGQLTGSAKGTKK